MPLFPLPTATKVRAASKLTVAQYNPRLSTSQFDVEIASIIGQAADFVTGGILDAAGSSEWPASAAVIAALAPSLDPVEERARQIGQATTTTELEALARLWEAAGALNDQYDEESDRLRLLADRERASLVGSIARFVVAPTVTPTPKPTLKRPRSSVARLKPVV